MFTYLLRKKEELQRLNLECPQPAPSPSPLPAQATPDPNVAPARLEAIQRRAEKLLKSGRKPDWLFVGRVGQGILTFQPAPDQVRSMLLFSHPFGAADYLRANRVQGKVGQFKVEELSGLSRTWRSQGIQTAALDRCPRCPQFLSVKLDALASMTTSDFVTVWAYQRATRMVMAETRIISAGEHLRLGEHAAARADYEYIRDHFDCGVPYLHQIIGILAGVHNDEPAKLAAIERLKEFGPQFEGPLDFSVELIASATYGLMMNFLMLKDSPAE